MKLAIEEMYTSRRAEQLNIIAVKSCRLRSGRYEERSNEEFSSYRAKGVAVRVLYRVQFRQKQIVVSVALGGSRNL